MSGPSFRCHLHFTSDPSTAVVDSRPAPSPIEAIKRFIERSLDTPHLTGDLLFVTARTLVRTEAEDDLPIKISYMHASGQATLVLAPVPYTAVLTCDPTKFGRYAPTGQTVGGLLYYADIDMTGYTAEQLSESLQDSDQMVRHAAQIERANRDLASWQSQAGWRSV